MLADGHGLALSDGDGSALSDSLGATDSAELLACMPADELAVGTGVLPGVVDSFVQAVSDAPRTRAARTTA